MINNSELLEYRKRLVSELVQERLFFTTGLLSIIRNWVIDPNLPTAGISKNLDVYLGTMIDSYEVFKYAILHEISHVPHIANDSSIFIPAEYKEHKDKKWVRQILNVAMDTALNEFLKKMIPKEYELVIKPKEMEYATFESFDTQFKPLNDQDITKPNESAIYYSYLAFSRLEGKIPKDGEGSGGSFDEHDWGDLTEAEKEVIKGKIKEAEEIGKNLGVSQGKGALDNPISVNKVKVPQHIINTLLKIKTQVSRILVSNEQLDDNFRRPRSREGFLLPTDSLDIKKDKVGQIVVILDTSGSMFDSGTLSHSASLCAELIKRKKVMAAYCCDTELKPINIKKPLDGLKGGGGTTLDNSHTEIIRKEYKLKSNIKLDIIYVTDGEVDLTEIKKDKNVNLHVIINKGELE